MCCPAADVLDLQFVCQIAVPWCRLLSILAAAEAVLPALARVKRRIRRAGYTHCFLKSGTAAIVSRLRHGASRLWMHVLCT